MRWNPERRPLPAVAQPKMVTAMSEMCIPEPGEVIVFEYPTRNKVDRDPEYRTRRVIVREIYDLAESPPIDGEWLTRRPLIDRGRHLIVGFDLDAGREKSFYLEAMREFRTRCALCLALYDPIDGHRPGYCKGPYAPTEDDRYRMAATVRVFNELTADNQDVTHNVGSFPLLAEDWDRDGFELSTPHSYEKGQP